ncbi:MAG: TPM domain-containing protein [Bacteroidales bacterium]|nr:TPM domain-containing protein [Bacteroidales bacterium]
MMILFRQHLMRLALLLVAFLAIAIATIAQTLWTIENTPMPHLEDRTRYVINPEGLMSLQAQKATDRVLRQLQDSIGVQGVVVIVNRVAGGDCYEYILRLAQKYGVGQRNSTGFAMVVSMQDRCYYIVSGRGLEGVLPDAMIHRIQAEVLAPELLRGNIDVAVEQTVRRLAEVALADGTLTKDGSLVRKYTDSQPPWILGVIVMKVFVIAMIVYMRRKRKRCPKCHKGDRYVSHTGPLRHNGHRWTRLVTYQCTHCNYVEQREEEDPRSGGNHGHTSAVLLGALLGSTMGSGRRGGFGGGSFGGGGAGGRF